MKIFDPLVANYYKNKYGGGNAGGSSGGGGGDSTEEWIGDGNTHLWISLREGRTSPMVGVCPNGTVTVDWGDGSEPDVLTGTSVFGVSWTPNHQYAKAGDYVITLTVDGTMGLIGASATNVGNYLLTHSSSAHTINNAYKNALKKVEIGRNVTISSSNVFYNCYALKSITISDGVTSIDNSMFNGCFALESITIPDGVTSIGSYAFQKCYALESITIPDGVTSIGDGAFSNCFALESITIPDGVTSIGNSMFNGCFALESITIPDGVTSIGSGVFNSCYSLKHCDFTSHTTVPTLSNTSAFNNIPADFEIRVPAALYDEWIAATNWATYASNIVAR